ncbi:MAG: hypothetical protein ACKOC5_00070 [Chloroflexota bacterium]
MFRVMRTPGRAAAGLVLLVIVVLALGGCSRTPAAPAQVTPLVVMITQVVTQIIPPTPVPVTDTPAPPPTQEPPTPSPTFDPMAAPIYYPLKDCVASRLHVGDIAMVSYVGGANGIRFGRDLAEDTIIGYAQPGTRLEVVDGPWCSRGWIIWFVRANDGTVGYTPEGDGNEYWLLPTAP